MLSWFSIACTCNDAPVGKLSANTCVISLYFFIPKKDENCQKHTYIPALTKNTDLLHLLNSCNHGGLIMTQFPAECATVVMWRTREHWYVKTVWWFYHSSWLLFACWMLWQTVFHSKDGSLFFSSERKESIFNVWEK